MTKTKQKFFSDEQVQHLILSYLYNKERDVPEGEVQNFLNACISITTTAKSIEMAADGLLLIDWDSVVGTFSFGLTNAGRDKAAELRMHS